MEALIIMCNLLTEEDFYESILGDIEKINYVKNILKMDKENIYGEVVSSYKGIIFIKPYSIYGEKRQIFLEQKDGWGIAAHYNINIHIGDFVKGILIINKEIGKLEISNVQKLTGQDEFEEELARLLRKKWEREGFKFNKNDIVRYDDRTMVFEKWVAEEVEAKLEEKYDTFINEKMKSKEQELKNIKEEISKKNEELDKIKKEYNDEEQRKNLVLEKIKEAEDKYCYYKELGIIKEEEISDFDDIQIYNYTTYEELITQVWGYLWNKKKLYYEKSIIRSFMNALRTQQLILIWGRPGTGKTSLPKNIAKAIGAECVVIQVQSNWTDNQDILGFYNPVDKRYISTQFLDAIVEARKHSKQLYIILLDEMNLSNIEYYFSEMLNIFTKKTDEIYKLYLYSEKYKIDAMKDLENAKKLGNNISEYKCSRIEEMFNDYPPVLEIPDNIRFVGTLNTDETTKTISPKVIDRSCVIELQTISKKIKEQALERDSLPNHIELDDENEIVVDKSVFDVKTVDIPEDNPLKIKINTIKEIFEEKNIPSPLSNRVYLYIDQWLAWEDNIVSEDEVILEKFLPSLDMEATPDNLEILKEIKKNLDKEKHKKSWKKLEIMEKAEKGRIMYWEN